MERRWYRAEEIASYLLVSKKQVYNLCEKGILPHTKIKGIGLRIDKKKVDELLESKEVIPVEDQLKDKTRW